MYSAKDNETVNKDSETRAKVIETGTAELLRLASELDKNIIAVLSRRTYILTSGKPTAFSNVSNVVVFDPSLLISWGNVNGQQLLKDSRPVVVVCFEEPIQIRFLCRDTIITHFCFSRSIR